MTQIPFDQFSKEFLEELLSPFGTIERSLEIPGESVFVDLFFTPAIATELTPAPLGILGRIANTKLKPRYDR